MRDDKRRRQTLKIELLSQWKLEAEFRNLRGLINHFELRNISRPRARNE